jgi:hypothetical protein
MRTFARVIGAALIIMFGIHGMYQTALPAMVLHADAGAAKALESVSWNASAKALPFVKTVMTMDPARRAAGAARTRCCVFPVSLERVNR